MRILKAAEMRYHRSKSWIRIPYNKRISAFLQVNNFASQRYMRWYNYPVQIFQVMGGVTARF